MTQKNNLQKYCRVATNKKDDNFVGVRGDTNGLEFVFPLGYQLSEDDSDIRRDVLHLLSIIKEFKVDENKGEITQRKDPQSKEVDFPFNAYLEVIHYFLENGYYMETDPIYKTQSRGKIHWSKTIKNQMPFLKKNTQSKYRPIYTQFTVRKSAPNDDKEITRINQFCVYESFWNIGLLFSSYMPPKPNGKYDGEGVKNRYLTLIQDKLAKTNNDNKKRLFKAMIEVLSSYDGDSDKKFHYGTVNFHNIFEKLIDEMFGIEHKDIYYPKAKWSMKFNKDKKTYPLQPDTIMEHENKIFVIDSKYYKYGNTKDTKDLPQATSINKQITYAEYARTLEYCKDKDIYNAFLLPYNKESDRFPTDDLFVNVGEAVGEWRGESSHDYEHIQCILVDIKHLMNNYRSPTEDDIIQLSDAIMEAFENKEFYEN